MDYRLYAILTVLEAEKIDFTQVKETSIETIRKSIDGLLTFVEFDCDNIAEFLEPLQVIKVVTYDELISILSTSEWTSNII
jgi:hypothetical protein